MAITWVGLSTCIRCLFQKLWLMVSKVIEEISSGVLQGGVLGPWFHIVCYSNVSFVCVQIEWNLLYFQNLISHPVSLRLLEWLEGELICWNFCEDLRLSIVPRLERTERDTSLVGFFTACEIVIRRWRMDGWSL